MMTTNTQELKWVYAVSKWEEWEQSSHCCYHQVINVRLFNLPVCPSGVRLPAVMDLDTSLETTPPTGGTVITHIHSTAASRHTGSHNKHTPYFTMPVFVHCPAACRVVHELRRAASKSSIAKRTRTTRSQSSKIPEGLHGSVMESVGVRRIFRELIPSH